MEAECCFTAIKSCTHLSSFQEQLFHIYSTTITKISFNPLNFIHHLDFLHKNSTFQKLDVSIFRHVRVGYPLLVVHYKELISFTGYQIQWLDKVQGI